MKNFLDFLNELKSETLLKAAEITDKRGHRGKAERFRRHSWTQRLKQYSKWGLFSFQSTLGVVYKDKDGRVTPVKANEKRKKERVQLPPAYFSGMEIDMLLENWDGSYSPSFPIFFKRDIEHKEGVYVSFCIFSMIFDFKNDDIFFEPMEIEYEQCVIEDVVMFGNRGSANRFKRMMEDEPLVRKELERFANDTEMTRVIYDYCSLTPEQFVDTIFKMIRNYPLDKLYKD